jgi:tetratricopeptide (TPR) repeat protein
MGRVVAARDPGLNREVAIKFLLPSPDPSAAARFVREAEITARLPHPGVPPVHALGRTPAGQPFLVMKLIRGRTLADLLAARPDPAADLPHLLAVFERVCEAVGYAHAQGIVHRDLKPANVMVGAFGEVQVMDWGLARDRAEGGAEGADAPPRPDASPGAGATLRVAQSALTMSGTVLGTPGYMAPEQARGQALDARADVFALGGILAAVLTGRQPIPNSTDVCAVAEDGIAAAAAVRDGLAGAGADPELTRLAYRCLGEDPGERPVDGQAVAEAVAAHRANAEGRARRAEADRASAEARAAADRRARRAQAGLAVAVAFMVGLLGAVAWWRDRTDRDRTRYQEQVEAEQARVELEHHLERERAEGDRRTAQQREDAERRAARDAAEQNLALATDLRDRFRFEQARQALRSAEALAARAGAAGLGRQVAGAKAHLETVRALDAARTKQLVWVPEKGGLGRFADASGDFRQAFADAGFDLAAEDLDALADRVTRSAIKAQLVAALDDWAPAEPDRALQARVLEVARLADPGPWTDRFRDGKVRDDPARVAVLAAEADPRALPPAVLVALARHMMSVRLDPLPLLLRAHAAHPADFPIAFHLAGAYTDRDPRRAVEFSRAARAVRPDNFAANINLGVNLRKVGEPAEAVEAFRAAARIDPDSPMAAYNLGRALAATGDWRGGAEALRRAVRLLPTYTDAHHELTRILVEAGDRPGAVEAAWAAARAIPRSDPGADAAWERLINLLDRASDRGGYLEAYRGWAAAAPGNAHAQTQCGGVLVNAGRLGEGIATLRNAVHLAPTDPTPYHFLGIAHINKGDEAAAARWLRRAVELDPTDAWAQTRLGGTLINTGRDDEGLAALRTALRLDPRHVTAHVFLGVACVRKQDHAAAAAAFGRAAELAPDFPRVHHNFGTSLLNAGNPAAAVAPLREAVRQRPTDPGSRVNLGRALLETGRPAEAADAFRETLRHAPGFSVAVAGLADAQRALAAPPLPAAPPPRPVGR